MGSASHPSVVELPATVQFRDPDAAKRALARVSEFAPQDIIRSVLTCLAVAPDADCALRQFERLSQCASPKLWEQLQTSAFLVQYAVLLFGYSEWIGETLIRNQDLFAHFASSRAAFHRPRSREYFEGRLQEAFTRYSGSDFAALLAGFKRREYSSILLRDLLGIVTLSQVTAEISCLSDVVIEAALSETQRNLSCRQPSHLSSGSISEPLAVISLGKLGGNELNYSSDIDLLYLYDDSGGSRSRRSREYFVRVAQDTTELLSKHTPEGTVFRIDLRLRPQGNQGELAISLAHAARYYREVAEDWELQALIKARHSAGAAPLSQRFIRAVEPHVYRPVLNFAAIKTALRSREKMDKHRRGLPAIPAALQGIDVKLDHGGIRDIEFLVQCLQRVYGGSEPWLRSSGTLFALQKLYDKQHLSSSDFHSLNDTYVFLRNIEHRLQLRHGRQTHRLLTAASELQTMARSIGRQGSTPYDAETFLSEVRTRMSQVSATYRRVVLHQGSQSEPAKPAPGFRAGNGGPLYKQFLEDTSHEAPEISASAGNVPLTQHGWKNLERFLGSAANSVEVYAQILRSPHCIRSATRLFELSDLVSEMLSRSPSDLPLLEPELETGSAPSQALDKHSPETGTTNELLLRIRSNFRKQMFVSAARDVLSSRDVYVSTEEKSEIADRAIRTAFQGVGAAKGFTVMALGRLGSREFDVLSDADLVFLADESLNEASARRSAEQLVQALTLYTREGTVFAVDTRLRPHGNAGDLIITPTQLSRYFATEAQAWEALTYLRLRYVAGDHHTAQRALTAVQQDLVPAIRARTGFMAELADVRERLANSDAEPNLKTEKGGLFDVDYILGVLQIQANLPAAANLRSRITLLEQESLLEASDAKALEANALFLRSLEHAIRLATGKAGKWLPFSEPARRSVEQLMSPLLRAGDTVATQLHSALQQNRELYRKYCCG
jgi:glutamate-ammonia-ligase adenylyltransferase